MMTAHQGAMATAFRPLSCREEGYEDGYTTVLHATGRRHPYRRRIVLDRDRRAVPAGPRRIQPYTRALVGRSRRYQRAPERDHGPETIGIFATRSPVRPNPIALSAVPVLGIDTAAGIIAVPYVDADDGTPVLDIKPYLPATERIRDVKVPAWSAHWPQWYEDNWGFDWAAEFTFED